MYPNFPYPLPDPKRATEAVDEAWVLLNDRDASLSFRKFRMFHETGDRLEYETDYIEHRKRLCAFAAGVLAGTEADIFLPELCDTVWAVCDEYTWALPAHIPENASPEETVERIDLFAAETAMALSELSAAVGHLLPKAVNERILYEVNRRIFIPYEKALPSFGHNNWSAVCACGVGCSYLATKNYARFEKVKENLLRNLSDFLESIPDDGCCLEGSLYYAYGFGFFTYFADALYEYSNGKINLFADPKTERLARFGLNSVLSGNCVLSFSDAPHTLSFDPGFYAILSRHYPDIVIPDEKYASHFGDDVRYRFAPFIRNLYATETKSETVKKNPREKIACETIAHETIVYETAGWFIRKGLCGKTGAFAAKAGHNDEPHNHNDVGSFLFFADGKYILDDLGWESYKKGYFDPERRYGKEFLCAASSSHSVPIPDGKVQKAGKQYAGKILFFDDNTVSMDLSAAYDLSETQKILRTFRTEENRLILRDETVGLQTLTERFVTRIEPILCDGYVRIGDFRLSASCPCVLSVEKHSFLPRFSGENGYENRHETAYFIDFIPEKITDITFILEKNEADRKA